MENGISGSQTNPSFYCNNWEIKRHRHRSIVFMNLCYIVPARCRGGCRCFRHSPCARRCTWCAPMLLSSAGRANQNTNVRHGSQTPLRLGTWEACMFTHKHLVRAAVRVGSAAAAAAAAAAAIETAQRACRDSPRKEKGWFEALASVDKFVHRYRTLKQELWAASHLNPTWPQDCEILWLSQGKQTRFLTWRREFELASLWNARRLTRPGIWMMSCMCVMQVIWLKTFLFK